MPSFAACTHGTQSFPNGRDEDLPLALLIMGDVNQRREHWCRPLMFDPDSTLLCTFEVVCTNLVAAGLLIQTQVEQTGAQKVIPA